MRCRCSAWKFFLFLSALFAPALFLTACSGVSHSAGNMGGTSGGSGGGTGGSGLACNGMSVGQTASLNGFVPFSNTSLWNTDIASAPIDPNSNTMISNWVGSVNLHPDWGTDPTYGIPYVVVNGSQGLVNVNLGAYGNESDPGPMPVPASAPVEGGSDRTPIRPMAFLTSWSMEARVWSMSIWAPMATRVIPDPCRSRQARQLRVDHQARAIATCWCSTMATAFSTNCITRR